MNTFGTSSKRLPLYDNRAIIDDRTRFRRADIPDLARANSFYFPSGKWPARGWLLLARKDYDELDTYSTSLQLEIGDPTKSDNVATIKNLSIVQARCVSRGLASDPNALYLVEITDGRGIIHNKWFQYPTNNVYNIRAPAYPQTFHPASLNSGTTWTWSTMLQNLWEQMSTFLGDWPGLPSGVTPAGIPEGQWLTGIPAWIEINDVLDHLGMTVACNPTQDNPFTIVQCGATDTTFSALQTRYLTHLEDDLEWIDTGAARVPKYVNVLFRRRNSIYGTEETVTYRSDGPYQWDMSSSYTVTVTAPSTFSSAVGTHFLWSDFTVRYDQDNNPLAADTAIASTLAQERVTQYFGRIYRQTLGYMNQTYAGALPFSTGNQVDGVCWYMDYSSRDNWAGWRTQIVRGAHPPWPDLWD